MKTPMVVWLAVTCAVTVLALWRVVGVALRCHLFAIGRVSDEFYVPGDTCDDEDDEDDDE